MLGLSRPKAGFQSESLYRNFHHVSNNDNETDSTLAQNEHGSGGSKKLEKLFSGP